MVRRSVDVAMTAVPGIRAKVWEAAGWPRVVALRSPEHPSGKIAVPMWVRYSVGAEAVAARGLVIPMPPAPDWRKGSSSGPLVVGSYSGDFELVDPETAVGAYRYESGVPTLTVEVEAPL